jgi:hypothetical protein
MARFGFHIDKVAWLRAGRRWEMDDGYYVSIGLMPRKDFKLMGYRVPCALGLTVSFRSWLSPVTIFFHDSCDPLYLGRKHLPLGGYFSQGVFQAPVLVKVWSDADHIASCMAGVA